MILWYFFLFLPQEQRTSWINAIESNAPHCSVRGMWLLLYLALCMHYYCNSRNIK